MIELLGDEKYDNINLPNGYIIKIDYGDSTKEFGWMSRYTGDYRRVRLFDENENLISELIEENSHRQTTDLSSGPVYQDILL